MKILKEKQIKGKYIQKGEVFATVRANKYVGLLSDEYYLTAESDTHYFMKYYKTEKGVLKGFDNFSILDLRKDKWLKAKPI